MEENTNQDHIKTSGSNTGKKIALAAVIVLLAVGGLFLYKSMKHSAIVQQQAMQMQTTKEKQPTQAVGGTEASPSGAITQGSEVKFDVTGSNFAFSPKVMTVKKGDKVTITFKNADGSHNLVIDEYNVKTPVIKTGETASVSFIADKVGTFSYYCSVGMHRKMGMEGTLTVQ